MGLSIHELFTDQAFNAGANAAAKRYAAELLAEDPTRTAQQLVDLIRDEADTAEAELDELRDHG